MRILDQTVKLRSGSGRVPAQIFAVIPTIRKDFVFVPSKSWDII